MTPWAAACQASLSITSFRSLLMSIEWVMPSNHLILCRPLLLLLSVFPSIRWPKYWSCSFCISPSNEYSGLIPFRIHWLDLLAVQGTLKSLLQHHSSKKNTFESVLMRWMKLEPIIQSEASQKEKHQYNILMHIYGI